MLVGLATAALLLAPAPAHAMYAAGMNLYQYCNSSPVMRVDPQGLKDYKVGTDDPRVGSDAGAGAFDSEEWKLYMWGLKRDILSGCYLIEGSMPNAVAHLRHYFDESGSTYTINLVGMIRDVPSAKDLYKDELRMAKAFAETLDVGDHDITSGSASGGYDTKAENADWFYAVGGYSAWGKGKVSVTCENGKKKYKLAFSYNFRDRYNWDTGKSVTIAGITVTDAFMGTFHRQGLAREFDMIGQTSETVEWVKGDTPGEPSPGGGGDPGRGGR